MVTPSFSSRMEEASKVAGRHGVVALCALSLIVVACSSRSPTSPVGGDSLPPSTPATTSSCALQAGLSGTVDDRGSGSAQGGAVTLDAGDSFFAPTCVTGTGEMRVTVKNSGAMLHSLSVASQQIDKDVAAGESIAVSVNFPASGALPFFCKYHVAQGMQGGFIAA